MSLENIKLNIQNENDRHKREIDRLNRCIDNENNKHYQNMKSLNQQKEQAIKQEKAKHENCKKYSMQELTEKFKKFLR